MKVLLLLIGVIVLSFFIIHLMKILSEKKFINQLKSKLIFISNDIDLKNLNLNNQEHLYFLNLFIHEIISNLNQECKIDRLKDKEGYSMTIEDIFEENKIKLGLNNPSQKLILTYNLYRQSYMLQEILNELIKNYGETKTKTMYNQTKKMIIDDMNYINEFMDMEG